MLNKSCFSITLLQSKQRLATVRVAEAISGIRKREKKPKNQIERAIKT
jgi:hypothetical protein